MHDGESMLANNEGPYADIHVQCKCGHSFWWATHKYGPEPLCGNCERRYSIMITLTVKEDES